MTHIENQLDAYYDGELAQREQQRVEAHVATCEACRAKLAELMSISTLLAQAPQQQSRLSDDRFVAQVALRLPRRTTVQRAVPVGWKLVPAVLVAVWLFVQTAGVVAQSVVALRALGLGRTQLAWLTAASPEGGVATELLYAVTPSVLGPYDLALELLVSRSAGPLVTGLAQLATLNVVLPALLLVALASWLGASWAYRRHRELEEQS
jgi:predicted anti-sigma-YlaC factor YlaD